MPSLPAAEVRRIAMLARLELSDTEVERLTAELAAILEYAAQVQRVDTNTVTIGLPSSEPPTTRPPEPPHRDALRSDTLAPSLPRTAVLEDAPGGDSAAGFFTVPRVLGA